MAQAQPYAYYVTESLTAINTAEWNQNGSIVPSSSGAVSSTSGSLTSKRPIPGSWPGYEVAFDARLATSGGGFVAYIRASADAHLGTYAVASTGQFYAIQFWNPQIGPGGCAMEIKMWKKLAGGIRCRSAGACILAGTICASASITART